MDCQKIGSIRTFQILVFVIAYQRANFRLSVPPKYTGKSFHGKPFLGGSRGTFRLFVQDSNQLKCMHSQWLLMKGVKCLFLNFSFIRLRVFLSVRFESQRVLLPSLFGLISLPNYRRMFSDSPCNLVLLYCPLSITRQLCIFDFR